MVSHRIRHVKAAVTLMLSTSPRTRFSTSLNGISCRLRRRSGTRIRSSGSLQIITAWRVLQRRGWYSGGRGEPHTAAAHQAMPPHTPCATGWTVGDGDPGRQWRGLQRAWVIPASNLLGSTLLWAGQRGEDSAGQIKCQRWTGDMEPDRCPPLPAA